MVRQKASVTGVGRCNAHAPSILMVIVRRSLARQRVRSKHRCIVLVFSCTGGAPATRVHTRGSLLAVLLNIQLSAIKCFWWRNQRLCLFPPAAGPRTPVLKDHAYNNWWQRWASGVDEETGSGRSLPETANSGLRLME